MTAQYDTNKPYSKNAKNKMERRLTSRTHVWRMWTSPNAVRLNGSQMHPQWVGVLVLGVFTLAL